jgi:hypothetical protein
VAGVVAYLGWGLRWAAEANLGFAPAAWNLVARRNRCKAWLLGSWSWKGRLGIAGASKE